MEPKWSNFLEYNHQTSQHLLEPCLRLRCITQDRERGRESDGLTGQIELACLGIAEGLSVISASYSIFATEPIMYIYCLGGIVMHHWDDEGKEHIKITLTHEEETNSPNP